MPEGPEVRTNTDQLRKLIEGKKLVRIKAVSGKLLRQGVKVIDNLGDNNYYQANENLLVSYQLIKNVNCLGKLIYIDLECGSRITSTLGMSGWWYSTAPSTNESYVSGQGLVHGEQAKIAHAKALAYARLNIELDDNTSVSYCDMRNFGNISVWTPGTIERPLRKIGVDLLELSKWLYSAEIMYSKLVEVAGKLDAATKYTNLTVAELLLQQDVIAGLGNIYRAEALYLSKVDPEVDWDFLNLDTKLKLLMNAAIVLNIAYHTKGLMYYPAALMTSNDYPAKDIIGRTLVYGQSQTPYGEKVLSKKLGSRTIWYVQ